MSSIPANYPDTLILEPSDDITGTYQRLERGHTRDGEDRAIAILEVDGAERSLWLHEKALRGQFRELNPEPGELIRICKGASKKKSASGYSYWPFKVTAPDRPVETVNWDSPLLSDDDESATTSQPDVPIDTSNLEPAGQAGEVDNGGDIPF